MKTKTYIISVPSSTVNVAGLVCPKCGYPVPDRQGNKFIENVRGIINLHIRERALNIDDAVTNFSSIWEALFDADREGKKSFVLQKGDFERLYKIVREAKSWGDLEGQIEVLKAFREARENEEELPIEQ